MSNQHQIYYTNRFTRKIRVHTNIPKHIKNNSLNIFNVFIYVSCVKYKAGITNLQIKSPKSFMTAASAEKKKLHFLVKNVLPIK